MNLRYAAAACLLLTSCAQRALVGGAPNDAASVFPDAQCPAGESYCSTGASSSCVDPSLDGQNCGSCGHVCASGTQCSGGFCITLSPAALPVGRQDMTAVAAPDGSLFVLGGRDKSGAPIGAVLAYNPSTNVWVTAATLPTPRFYLAGALGPDGLLYAIGGQSTTKALATVEAYDPVAGTWKSRAPLPSARYMLAAATGPDGRIYAIGGTSNGIASPTAGVDAYDPRTDTWTSATPLPGWRFALAAVTGPDGRIYAIGGTGNEAISCGDATCYTWGTLADVEVYDTSAKTWTAVAPLPSRRSSLAAAIGPNGHLYAIFGDDDLACGGGPTNTLFDFDPSKGAWSAAAPGPGGSQLAAAAGAGPHGLIYVIGGWPGSSAVAAYSTLGATW